MAVLNLPRIRALAARRFPLMRDGRAVTALEYGIVAAFFCLVLLGIFSTFGTALTSMFNRTSSGI